MARGKKSPPLKRRQTNSPKEIQHRSSSLKDAWVYGSEICLLISEHVLEEQESLGDFSRNKRAGRQHFPLLHPSSETRTPAGTGMTSTLSTWLAYTVPTLAFSCGSTPSHLASLGQSFGQLHFLSHSEWVQNLLATSPDPHALL